MIALEHVRRYLTAWNAHDQAALAATFRPGGTYQDPLTGGPVPPEALSHYAAGLFASFPDLRFDEELLRACGEDTVMLAWTMRGTNHGSLRGLPPTGRIIAVAGMDWVTVRADGIERVQGYFDRQAVPEQLGLRVTVQPDAVGPVRFGGCTRVWSDGIAPPAALALTMVEARSDAEVDEIRDASRQIMIELLQMPGFLSFQGAVVGRRLTTVTLWESPAAARQVMRQPIHKAASARMFSGATAQAFHASQWAPVHLGELWRRCESCGDLWDARAKAGCECGAAPGVRPAYW